MNNMTYEIKKKFEELFEEQQKNQDKNQKIIEELK